MNSGTEWEQNIILISDRKQLALITEQGFNSTRADVDDLRRVSSRYADKKKRVAQYMGEYNSDRCTIE
ncbi:hypothetical protein T12_6731 [Trichinella patagoniensis]|uniref:Uncharacterized protein n=1 Tax=Trichinella patagoniensis TaxID=990121 RepID=A0A0V0ZYY8_9BILA|nr:hypothetical protein T12_6731 [Trichinella patagoniensis]